MRPGDTDEFTVPEAAKLAETVFFRELHRAGIGAKIVEFVCRNGPFEPPVAHEARERLGISQQHVGEIAAAGDRACWRFAVGAPCLPL